MTCHRPRTWFTTSLLSILQCTPRAPSFSAHRRPPISDTYSASLFVARSPRYTPKVRSGWPSFSLRMPPAPATPGLPRAPPSLQSRSGFVSSRIRAFTRSSFWRTSSVSTESGMIAPRYCAAASSSCRAFAAAAACPPASLLTKGCGLTAPAAPPAGAAAAARAGAATSMLCLRRNELASCSDLKHLCIAFEKPCTCLNASSQLR